MTYIIIILFFDKNNHQTVALSRREIRQCRNRVLTSLPPFWHLIVRGCLLWRGLPWVILLEASLAYKERLPGAVDGWALEPFTPRVGAALFLLCHASCVTLSRDDVASSYSSNFRFLTGSYGLALTPSRGCARVYPMGITPLSLQAIYRISRGDLSIGFLFPGYFTYPYVRLSSQPNK
jgi:hypothetical protein